MGAICITRNTYALHLEHERTIHVNPRLVYCFYRDHHALRNATVRTVT